MKGWVIHEVIGMTRMYDRLVTLPMKGREDDIMLSSIYPVTDEVFGQWWARVEAGEAKPTDPTIGVILCRHRDKHLEIGAVNCECRGKTPLITGFVKVPGESVDFDDVFNRPCLHGKIGFCGLCVLAAAKRK